jgi:arginine decarboxylase
MDQYRAPLYEALRERRLLGETSFHVPGHKFGAGLEQEERTIFGSVMEVDYTEIEGLDDLHHPEGVILEAEQLAAECFGAEESFFLVGGSTAGNLAAITAVCSRGDVVLVQRNVHKSVIHGLMLAGARAVFLSPVIDKTSGIAAGVSIEVLKTALDRYPMAKAVFLSNPNYYGMGLDLLEYVEGVHSYQIPLLVDEAHGAHFGFHPEVPPSAISRGADIVIQSTHKMLTAMTMGAMLHVQGSLVNRGRLKRRLAMLQSSSPSYPIMASLDLARRRAALSGQRLLEEALGRILHIKYAIRDLRWISCLENGEERRGFDYLDPLKISIYDRTAYLNGFRLQEELGKRGVIAEMADDRYVVLALSLATGRSDTDRLITALLSLDNDTNRLNGTTSSEDNRYVTGLEDPVLPQDCESLDISEPVLMGLDENHDADTVRMPLEEAVGNLAAESVIPYPPGIPLVFPGEIIRAVVIKQIQRLARAGARFQGALQDRAGCSILIKKPNGE